MKIIDEINSMVKSAGSSIASGLGSVEKKPSGPNPSARRGGSSPDRSVITVQNHGSLKNFDKKDFSDAYDFWREIAPFIKSREIGERYLPFRFLKVFQKLPSTPVVYKRLDGRTSGQAVEDEKSPTRQRIELQNIPGVATQSTLGHELRHVYERLMERMGDGFSRKSKDILQKVYGFEGVDIKPESPGYSEKWGPEEMFTTNKEHQILAYQDLKRSIGRKPTASEYFNYIKNRSVDELVKMRMRIVNAYQQKADKNITEEDIRRNIELYRKALMEISMMRHFGNWPNLTTEKPYALA